MLTTVNHHLQSPSVLDHSEAVDPMPAVQFCRNEMCLLLSLHQPLTHSVFPAPPRVRKKTVLHVIEPLPNEGKKYTFPWGQPDKRNLLLPRLGPLMLDLSDQPRATPALRGSEIRHQSILEGPNFDGSVLGCINKGYTIC